MAFPKYIAFLNSVSVATGTKDQVRTKALDIFNSPQYQDRIEGREVILRITTYGAQRFVSSQILRDGSK